MPVRSSPHDLPSTSDRAIQQIINARKDRYHLLHQYFTNIENHLLSEAELIQEQLAIVILTENAAAVGKRIQDLNLDNVSINSVKHLI